VHFDIDDGFFETLRADEVWPPPLCTGFTPHDDPWLNERRIATSDEGNVVTFTQAQLESLASALVDSRGGLTHSQITHYLHLHSLVDTEGDYVPKRVRVLNAFARNLNLVKSPTVVRNFIETACDPSRFLRVPEEFEAYRQSVNEALAFVGWAVGPDGHVRDSAAVGTLPEAQRRARELREDLIARHVHADVLAFCKAELLVDDYFHMVLEATKSVFAKIRSRTGLDGDGAELVDRAFSTDRPLWVINSFQTKSERTEQTGFCNLLKGMHGMFRHPTAHEPRISWAMTKEDAEDLLSLVSMIHRRLDNLTMPPRA
jgi:uncharacterized protein (TIGR02391 family)